MKDISNLSISELKELKKHIKERVSYLEEEGNKKKGKKDLYNKPLREKFSDLEQHDPIYKIYVNPEEIGVLRCFAMDVRHSSEESVSMSVVNIDDFSYHSLSIPSEFIDMSYYLSGNNFYTLNPENWESKLIDSFRIREEKILEEMSSDIKLGQSRMKQFLDHKEIINVLLKK